MGKAGIEFLVPSMQAPLPGFGLPLELQSENFFEFCQKVLSRRIIPGIPLDVNVTSCPSSVIIKAHIDPHVTHLGFRERANLKMSAYPGAGPIK